MRSVQPVGPYYIGGTCEGARISFEMVRLLEASGETVALLAIIDTWVLENTQNRTLWKVYYYSEKLRALLRQPWNSRLAVIKKALRNRLKWWMGPDSGPRKTEWTETYWPGDDFVPEQIQSRITIFKIPKQPFYYHSDPLLGWGDRSKSGVDAELVPNGKHNLLLREPYVGGLAASLASVLERVRVEPRELAGTPIRESEPADAAAVSR